MGEDYQKVAQFYNQQSLIKSSKKIPADFVPVKSWYNRFFITDKAGPDERLLDIGCGMGYLLAAAAWRGYAAYGVDIASQGFTYAKTFPFPMNLSVCDVDQGLPFASHSFDAVVSTGVLQYVRAPERVIREIIRVAKSRASIVIFVPNTLAWPRLLGRKLDNAEGKFSICRRSLSGWRSLFADNGLSVESVLADNSTISYVSGSRGVRRLLKFLVRPCMHYVPLVYAEHFIFICRRYNT